MLSILLQTGIDSLAQAAAEAAAAPVAASAAPIQVEQSFSLISMAAKGGVLMIVLLVLSILTIYIFGKKWWMIHQASRIDKNFMKDIRDYLHEGKIKSALELCSKCRLVAVIDDDLFVSAVVLGSTVKIERSHEEAEHY